MAAAACGRSATRTALSADGTTTTTSAGPASEPVAAAAGSSSAAMCLLTPEMTEGPYYLAGETIRSDVTDGRPGLPLRLELTVLDATACTPIPGATVEIWHADASGVYSGFGSGASSRTFLRGVQIADANGKVAFSTIYPGWYQGRATHIHLKVMVNGTVHTSQLFFPEAINSAVYATAPYATHAGSRTLNGEDNIFAGGGSATTLALSRTSSGYTGVLNLGVRR